MPYRFFAKIWSVVKKLTRMLLYMPEPVYHMAKWYGCFRVWMEDIFRSSPTRKYSKNLKSARGFAQCKSCLTGAILRIGQVTNKQQLRKVGSVQSYQSQFSFVLYLLLGFLLDETNRSPRMGFKSIFLRCTNFFC